MSVRFEKETIQQTGGIAAAQPVSHHPTAHKVGVALTGGAANEGTKGYLAVRYIRNLG